MLSRGGPFAGPPTNSESVPNTVTFHAVSHKQSAALRLAGPAPMITAFPTVFSSVRTYSLAFDGHIPKARRRREPDLPGRDGEFEVPAERVLRLAFWPLDPFGRQFDSSVTKANRLQQDFRAKLMTAVLPFHFSQDIGLRHSREVTLVCSPTVTHLAGLNGPFGARQRRVLGVRQTPLRARRRRFRRSRYPAARGSPWKVRALRTFGADDGVSTRTPSAWMISLVPSLPCAKSCS